MEGNKRGSSAHFRGSKGSDFTFVTGGAVPGSKFKGRKASHSRERDEQSDVEDQPEFLELEDELLVEVEKHEEDFKTMMKYLNEVESLVCGSEFTQIQSMIGCGQDHLGVHVKGYDKLFKDINTMRDDALDTIKLAAKYDSKAAKIASQSVAAQERLNGQLVEIKEDKVAEDKISSPVFKQESMNLGGNPTKDSVPLQKQKDDIVNKLMNMESDMRGYTDDIETKL